jgi:MoaA/NifB/PqqE/SkfB family radical SAM enzyme
VTQLSIRHEGGLEGIDLYVNAACNLTCSTCFLGDNYFDGTQMDLSTALDILRWTAEQGLTEVALLGGEPTMHPQLGTMIRAAEELGLAVRLVTNGGPSLRTFLKSAESYLVRTYYLSIDGPNESVHDAIRGPGSFKHVMASMRSLERRGADVVVTATLGRANAPFAAEVVALAHESGANRANLHWLSATGRAQGGEQSLHADEWEALRWQLESRLPKYSGFVVDIQLAFANPGSPELTFCAVRRGTNLQFMPSGAVHACGLMVDRPTTSSFSWAEGGLSARPDAEEAQRCHETSPEHGCPLRSHESNTVELPACIYVRQVLRSID